MKSGAMKLVKEVRSSDILFPLLTDGDRLF